MGRRESREAFAGFLFREPGDRPEVITEFVRGGCADGLHFRASVFCFYPPYVVSLRWSPVEIDSGHFRIINYAFDGELKSWWCCQR